MEATGKYVFLEPTTTLIEVLKEQLSPDELSVLISHRDQCGYAGLGDNYLEINHTRHSDFAGEAYEHVNCITLMRDFPEFMRSYSSAFNTEFLCIDEDQPIETEEELKRAIELADTLSALYKYGIHDEEAASNYEHELKYKAIEHWAKYEAPESMKELFPETDVLTEVAYNAYNEYDYGNLVLCEDAHWAYVNDVKLVNAIQMYAIQMYVRNIVTTRLER